MKVTNAECFARPRSYFSRSSDSPMESYYHVPWDHPPDDAAGCLASLALVHGLDCSLDHARDLLGRNDEGKSLLQLRIAAEQVGFVAKAVKGPFEALWKIPLPAVAHTKDADGGHFVVLYGISAESIVVGCSSGVVHVSHEAFASQYTGALLLAIPPGGGRGSQDGFWSRIGGLIRLLLGGAPI